MGYEIIFNADSPIDERVIFLKCYQNISNMIFIGMGHDVNKMDLSMTMDIETAEFLVEVLKREIEFCKYSNKVCNI